MNQIQLSNEQQQAINKFVEKVQLLIKTASAPITDQASLIESGNSKVALESYMKAVKAHFEPELAPLEERVKLLKNQVAALLIPAKTSHDDLVDRQRAWTAQEKARAAAETRQRQEQINRETAERIERDRRAAEDEAKRKRKEAVAKIEADFDAGIFGRRELSKRLKEAGAEEEAARATAAAVAEEEKDKPAATVRVAPSIPAVAGVRNQTYYYADVEDEQQIITHLCLAAVNKDMVRLDFLRRFVMVSRSEVSGYAREMKDSASVMASLPGVRAWQKG